MAREFGNGRHLMSRRRRRRVRRRRCRGSIGQQLWVVRPLKLRRQPWSLEVDPRESRRDPSGQQGDLAAGSDGRRDQRGDDGGRLRRCAVMAVSTSEGSSVAKAAPPPHGSEHPQPGARAGSALRPAPQWRPGSAEMMAPPSISTTRQRSPGGWQQDPVSGDQHGVSIRQRLTIAHPAPVRAMTPQLIKGVRSSLT